VIKDLDVFSTDDKLGELRLSLKELEAKQNELVDYDLVSVRGNAQSTVTLLTGAQAWPSVVAALESLDSRGSSMGLSLNSDFWQFARAVSQYTTEAKDDLLYNVTMLRFLIAGQSGPSGLRSFFLERSCNKDGEDTYLWNGPLASNCITYSGHADVSAKLRELGDKLGTNNGNGAVYRNNALGFQIFPHGRMWPELEPNPTIGLGQTQENHALMRAEIARVVGPPGEGRWTVSEVRAAAQAFWSDRTSVRIGADLGIWSTQVLHLVMLGIVLNDDDGAKFSEFQMKILLGTVLPPELFGPLGVDDALKDKAKRLERFKEALAASDPEVKAMDPEKVTLLASGAMDALLFAGGASIPSVLRWCIALLYSEWGRENLPPEFLLRESNLMQYVLEVIRRFPPVAGMGYVERSYDGQPDQQVFCNIFMAQRDPRVWGQDPDRFELRPVEEYERLSVGFAEPAVVDDNASANSHSCPAKDLSLVMVCEFMKAFIQTTAGVDAGDDQPLATEEWVCDKEPKKISITEYGSGDFVLTRKK
jgi:hypothetical protein